MEELIQQYLFQKKECPLPSIGTLLIKEGNTVSWFGDHKLAAPVPHIEFDRTEIPAENFIAFIAAQKHISHTDAAATLENYCRDLQNMDTYGQTVLDHAGKFFIDHNGSLVFKHVEVPKIFLPAISVQKVIHPNTSHTMRVGDTETTTAVMAEYYSEAKDIKKEKWWIAAVLLTLITASILFFYFNGDNHNAAFGNAQPVISKPATETYHTGN
jgi:hypothetical protein